MDSDCVADLRIQQVSIGFRSPVLWMTDTSPVIGFGQFSSSHIRFSCRSSAVRPQLTPTIWHHAIVPCCLSVQGKVLLYTLRPSMTGRSRLVPYAFPGALRNLSLYPLSYGYLCLSTTCKIQDLDPFVKRFLSCHPRICDVLCMFFISLDSSSASNSKYFNTNRSSGQRVAKIRESQEQ